MPIEPEEERHEERPDDVYEKLGIYWLQSLHRKLEHVRSLTFALTKLADELTDDEALERMSAMDSLLNSILETEIRPLAENRGQWRTFERDAQLRLHHEGLQELDPGDADFFSKYLRYVDIILGLIEQRLENWGLKLTPNPPMPDVVGITWDAIETEIRASAQKRIAETRNKSHA